MQQRAPERATLLTWGLFSITTCGLSPLVNLRIVTMREENFIVGPVIIWCCCYCSMLVIIWCCCCWLSDYGNLLSYLILTWWSWWPCDASGLVVRIICDTYIICILMMMITGTFWGRSSASFAPFRWRSGQGGGSREGFQELLDAQTPSAQSRRQE